MKGSSTVCDPDCVEQTKTDSCSAVTVRLSILLVNYNGARYLPSCLESLKRFAPPETQVVLEDNASTDGSVEAAENTFPWLRIVRSNRNLGFAGGNNLAATHAAGKFLLLINTDTVLLETISPAVDWLDNHPAYAAVTIGMLDGDRISRPSTGRFPSLFRLILLRTMLVANERYGPSETFDVDWLQGSFLLIRANVWHHLKGLDERYFMYGEDVDLCKRVWDMGYRCACLPRLRYLHWGGFDFRRFPHQVSGLANYVERHMTGSEQLLCIYVLYVGCFFRAVTFFAIGLLCDHETHRAKAKACWRAFKTLTQRQA